MNPQLILGALGLLTSAFQLRSGGLELLHSFTNETKIKGGLAELDGRYYFTAEKGGSHGLGYIGYIGRFDPAEQTLTPLYSFTTDAKPKGGLVRAGSVLFLQGEKGAQSTGFGWVGRFRPATGEFTELAAYSTDTKPKSGLVAAGGALWLATEKGGAGGGSIDRFDPVSGTLNTVANLTFESGLKIESFAISDDGASLYAGAREGGDAAELAGKGAGTLLRVDTTSGEATRLAVFQAERHGAKLRGLTLYQGKLWFVMEEGGDLTLNSGKGGGTIACYDLATGVLARLHAFDGTVTGLKPKGIVRAGADFYFVTELGGAGNLGVFGVCRGGTVVELLAELSAETSAKPDFALTVADNRVLFTTELGGVGFLGGIVAWTLPATTPVAPALRISRLTDDQLRLS